MNFKRDAMKVLILLGLILLMHIILLVNPGIFWDDWTLFNMSQEGIDEQFKGNGAYYTGISHLHNYLVKTQHPVLIYRVLTLILSAISTLILYQVFKSYKEVKEDSFYLSVIFTVAPFFLAKITLICLPYTICFTSFLVGYYLFIKIVNKSHLVVRLISLLFFFISFVTNSILFVYLMIPLHVWYVRRGSTLQKVVIDWLKFSDFMILPIIYWTIKSIYFRPVDFFALQDYNVISLKRLLYVPVQFVVTLTETFIRPISIFYENGYPYFFLAMLVGLIVISRRLPILSRYIPLSGNADYKKLLIIGFFLIFLCSFPYLLVGKIPSFAGYETRHQLLLPIGFSVVVVSFIGLIVVQKYRSIVFIAVICVLVSVQLQLQFRYLKGWLKEEAIMSQLKVIPFGEYKTLEVIDNTESYNPTDRAISFYEWGGMAKFVTGQEDRLFISSEILPDIRRFESLSGFVRFRKESKATLQRNMKDYLPVFTCHQFIISTTDKNLDSWWEIVQLTHLYYFERASFEEQIRGYVAIRFRDSCSESLEKLIK